MAAGTGSGATIGKLATALEELGLEEFCARGVAADWAAHFPLVSRSGSRRVARSLEGLGLDSGRALEAAGVMLALELQVKGAAYQDTLLRVEQAGVPGPVARAAAMEAVLLWRSALTRNPYRSRASVPMSVVPIGVGAAALVLARLLLFVS
jgi:hypothetical protein